MTSHHHHWTNMTRLITKECKTCTRKVQQINHLSIILVAEGKCSTHVNSFLESKALYSSEISVGYKCNPRRKRVWKEWVFFPHQWRGYELQRRERKIPNL
jgi:hypothetical protein